MDENSLASVRGAERIVWAAGWSLQEEAVLGWLTGLRTWPAPGLTRALRSSNLSRSTVSTSGTWDGRQVRGASGSGRPC